MQQSYKRLDLEARYQISELLARKMPQTAIAKELGISQSTVSRELRRNRSLKGCRAKRAHELASSRVAEKNLRHVRRFDSSVRDWALAMVEEHQWSPVQIAGVSLKRIGQSICHETVYRWIRENRSKGGKDLSLCAAKTANTIACRRKTPGAG